MIKDYLRVTYLTLIIFWPALMILIAAVGCVMFHLRLRHLGIVMITLLTTLGLAVWQFEQDI